MKESSVPLIGGVSTLSNLIAPMDRKDFYENYFEQKHVLIPGAATNKDFSDVFSVEAFDDLLCGRLLFGQSVIVAREGEQIDRATYSYNDGLIDPVRTLAYFDDGATVIINQAHSMVPGIGALCRGLERDLVSRFQTNIYMSPPNSQGFPAHWDSHDVFAIQLHGTKEWEFMHSPYDLPGQERKFERDRYEEGEALETLTTTPGDVLYIPRGLVHRVRSSTEASLHLTVGILNQTMGELLEYILRAAERRELGLRRSPPIDSQTGWLDYDGITELVKELLPVLADPENVRDGVEKYEREFLESRHPVPTRHLSLVMQLNDLSLDSVVSGEALTLPRVREEDGRIAIEVYGDTMTLSDMQLSDVNTLLTCKASTIRDLPVSIAEENRVATVRGFLLRRLMKLEKV